MRTPQEWLELRTEVLHDGGDADLYRWIATIQQEAFNEGSKQGMRDYQSMQLSGLEMIIVMDSINKTGNWAPKITNLDCCATDQCKVTTEEISPGDKRDIYGNIK